jgi:hypothetical protein
LPARSPQPPSNDTGDAQTEQLKALKENAERCRRLAGATYNREISQMLGSMADDYQRSAEELSVRREA